LFRCCSATVLGPSNLGEAEVRLAQIRAVEAAGVTHLKYRAMT
jgi:hypothetical protein